MSLGGAWRQAHSPLGQGLSCPHRVGVTEKTAPGEAWLGATGQESPGRSSALSPCLERKVV